MSVADIDPLELLTKKQAAARTGFSEHTLDRHRKEGKGIPYVRIGRTIRYRSADVAKYLAEHRVEPEKPRSHKPAPPAIVSLADNRGSLPPHLRGGRFR